MPQVKGGQKGRSGNSTGKKAPAKKPAPGRAAAVKQTADASSIIMGIVFLIAILVGAAAWMGQSISVVENKANQLADGAAKTFGFSIKSIQVVEVSEDLERVIRREIGVTEGDNMFRADPQELKSRLERVQGFGDVQVHRFWPNQLTVFVTPLEASVLYREGAGTELVAMHYTGEAAAELEPEAEYHVVQGVGSVEAWPALAGMLRDYPTIETRLDFAERVGQRRWDLLMTSGTRVRLPEGEEQKTALNVLAALQRETGVLDRQVRMIDLRDSARVYVSREDATYAEAQIGGAG